jgi:hypothetical protein
LRRRHTGALWPAAGYVAANGSNSHAEFSRGVALPGLELVRYEPSRGSKTPHDRRPGSAARTGLEALSFVPHSIHPGGIPYGNPVGITNILNAHLDVLYEKGEERPRVFQYCLHPKITGRPFRPLSVTAFLEHATALPGVRFMTMLELAQLCRDSPQ